MAKAPSPEPQCPCGSGLPYAWCCEPPHQGQAATTAEALMRSRYSAYALGLEEYVLTTWHPQTRPANLNLAQDTGKWIGLQIKSCEAGSESDAEGWVEFVARYKLNGKAQRLQERSHFVKQDGHWFYMAGELSSA